MKFFELKVFRQLIDKNLSTIYNYSVTKYMKRGGEL